MCPRSNLDTDAESEETQTGFVSRDDARYWEGPVVDGKKRSNRYHYYGWHDGARPGPQAFMVEKRAHDTSPAHFHGVDQFQVMFGTGGAWYQKNPISPIMLHYSDGYTPYGPFGADEEMMRFFTLRPRHNEVTGVMPQDRAKLTKRGKRNQHVDVSSVSDDQLKKDGELRQHSLLDGDDDRLAAWLLEAGPGASVTTPSASGSNGQYSCIVKGEVWEGDRHHGAHCLRWVGPDDPPLVLQAGDTGFSVLLVQFPYPGTDT